MQLGKILALIIWVLFASSISATYNHYRLPTAIQPDRYKLKIITYLEDSNNLSFEGDVSIHFKVLESTSNITLHARKLTIDESKITLRSSSDENFKYCSKGIEIVPENDYYIIQLCEALQKDQLYTVKLHFSAFLTENLQGYYRSSYVNQETNEKRWLSVTQFEPTGARAAFPCFDEPNYKAKFTIWLGHHKSLTALSNMPLETQLPINKTNNFVWSIFEESVPMSTYLVAYTVNDYGHITSPQLEGSNVEFRTWYQKQFLDQCNYAAEVGPKVLKYFEETFGIPFPLSKVDAIAVPDFESGAMENWGLITYRETALLFVPNISSEGNKARIVNVIAHELAHQWFGNLVTMKWWTDLWLNEGFATYVANLGVHNLSPEWNYYNEESLDNMLTIFAVDAQKSSHPISQPITDSKYIRSRFDSISYQKGSGVLRMLHMFMGHEGFFEAVRSYLDKHKYQNAEQDDLWAAFTETAYKHKIIQKDTDVKTIMDSWTLQTGYPLVKVIRDYNTGAIHISQQRYMTTSELPEEEAQKCWWVPLSFTTASEFDFMRTTPKDWLECDDNGKKLNLTYDSVSSQDEWILFNLQYSGVYRVMYDAENWRLLKNVLSTEKFVNIHVLNRAQLISDSLSLAWTGHQGYNVAFDILDYLIQEREYLPWKTAVMHLAKVKYLLKPFKEQSKYIKAYLRHIMEPIYYELGGINDTVVHSNNSHSALMFKSLIADLACALDQKDCISTAQNYFKQWKSSAYPGIHNPIPVDLRSKVYCIALRNGDENDWQFLFERYKKSNVATERSILLGTMGCIRNETLLTKYINMAYDNSGSVRKGESIFVLVTTAQSKVGFPLAWKYVRENMNKLIEFYGTQFSLLCQLTELLAGSILTPELRVSFNIFIETHKDYFTQCQPTIRSSLEKIDDNMKWIEKNAENMKEILESRLLHMGIQVTEEDEQD